MIGFAEKVITYTDGLNQAEFMASELHSHKVRCDGACCGRCEGSYAILPKVGSV